MLRRFEEKTRRAVLIEIANIVSNDSMLKRYAGKNALLDCALFMVASNDATSLERLNKYISTDELIEDVNHVAKSVRLRNAIRGDLVR